MGRKIKLDEKEYDLDNLSPQAVSTLAALQFAETQLQELSNMQALLQRAKNSYVESLKREILSNKSGLIFSDD